jgi:hypothetical protein
VSALRQSRPPTPSAAAARYYSLRRLSPYQGTVQVMEHPGFRAMSADGITWTVQMPNEGSRYATHALWRPDGSGTLVEDGRTEIPLAALRAHPPFPFPLADTLELWLLDAKQSLPLAILASTLPRATSPRVRAPAWQAALKGDDSFTSKRYAALGAAPGTSAGAPNQITGRTSEASRAATTAPGPRPDPAADESHRARLERRVQETAGAPARAQWFQRDTGGGTGLNGIGLDPGFVGRRLTGEHFPELLLREHWDNRGDAALVRDYHDWLAPRLLTHANLTRATRDRLERAACRQAEMFYRLRHLMPEAVNPELVQVAMVEAVIRRAGQADA